MNNSEPQEPVPVGYVAKYALQNFDVNGTEAKDVCFWPKGSLRPEYEIALYTHPAPAPVPDAVEADAIRFLYKHGELTHSAAHRAITLLTNNGFAIHRRAA